ncbi:DNA translocase FtsK, partial [Burkholderia ubonensis]|uniref:DNA translocase FtsK n=1 Tax=Burkholderia ubonensis TaxID=101571 RepID=UPI00016A671F
PPAVPRQRPAAPARAPLYAWTEKPATPITPAPSVHETLRSIEASTAQWASLAGAAAAASAAASTWPAASAEPVSVPSAMETDGAARIADGLKADIGHDGAIVLPAFAPADAAVPEIRSEAHAIVTAGVEASAPEATIDAAPGTIAAATDAVADTPIITGADDAVQEIDAGSATTSDPRSVPQTDAPIDLAPWEDIAVTETANAVPADAPAVDTPSLAPQADAATTPAGAIDAHLQPAELAKAAQSAIDAAPAVFVGTAAVTRNADASGADTSMPAGMTNDIPGVATNIAAKPAADASASAVPPLGEVSSDAAQTAPLPMSAAVEASTVTPASTANVIAPSIAEASHAESIAEPDAFASVATTAAPTPVATDDASAIEPAALAAPAAAMTAGLDDTDRAAKSANDGAGLPSSVAIEPAMTPSFASPAAPAWSTLTNSPGAGATALAGTTPQPAVASATAQPSAPSIASGWTVVPAVPPTTAPMLSSSTPVTPSLYGLSATSGTIAPATPAGTTSTQATPTATGAAVAAASQAATITVPAPVAVPAAAIVGTSARETPATAPDSAATTIATPAQPAATAAAPASVATPAAAIGGTPMPGAPTATNAAPTPDAAPAAPPPPQPRPNAFEFHAPATFSVELPTLDLLEPASDDVQTISEEQLAQTGQVIEQRLQEFKVPVTVVGASAGPVITRFEIEPALGVRGSQIVGLMKDLSRGLGLTSIRVVETIPGKTCMGLELPNAKRQMIRLSEILASRQYQHSASQLTIAMGKDITGHPVVTDLAKAPHMLVAGTTGSGKSVAINAMILSLLYKATPEDVRLIMIDPKMLELSVYEGIPHLLAPVVTDMKLAANALTWCVGEMEKRYRLMSAVGVRNLAGFNQKIRDAEAKEKKIGNPFSLTPEDPEPLSTLPLIVVVIDELADLMMVAGKKIEELIAR